MPLDVLSRTKLGLWLAGIAGAVLGVSIWAFSRQVVGWHVTECGFDAQGAFAKVRVNNLLGGDNYRKVDVFFYLTGKPAPFEATTVRVHELALGHGTGVAHVQFPTSRSFQGRSVYVLGPGSEHPRFVTKKFALQHRGVRRETVPDAAPVGRKRSRAPRVDVEDTDPLALVTGGAARTDRRGDL